MVATAGRLDLATLDVGPEVRGADYLPGDEAARRASSWSATAAAPPHIRRCTRGGRCSHRFEPRPVPAMTAIQDAGAGILLRSDTLREEGVAEAARRLCDDPCYAQAAARVQREMRGYDSGARFAGALDRVA